jgi:hypothetical protein
MPMSRRPTEPKDGMAAGRRAGEKGRPVVDGEPADENQLEKRIERLEDRLEESVRGNDGLAIARTDRGLDDSETEDALQRAVSRSNIKRGSRKA